MPSVTVHLHLAGLILDHWQSRPGEAPFAPDDDEQVNAFRVGAMGPDMGYLPGGFRPISELAHSLRPSDLARNLLDASHSPLQRAFSWGWVTHVLADILVHPLVGCAVGELLHGTPSRFVDGDQDQVSHVRVEAGVDAVYAERNPELRHLPLAPVFDQESIGFLQAAYRATYGVTPGRDEFLHSHLLSPRRLKQGLALSGLSALVMPPHPDRSGRPLGPLSRVRGFVSRQSVSLAFLLPAPPRLWLLNAVRDVEETFVELFVEEFRVGLSGLANLNLDTGRPDVEELGYGGLRRATAYLGSLGARVTDLLPAVASGAA